MNFLTDLADGPWKLSLTIWSGRTAWEVSERGELERRGLRLSYVGVKVVWVWGDLGRFLLRGFFWVRVL